MEKIYSLHRKDKAKEDYQCLIILKSNKLFNFNIEKYIENKFVHYRIKDSFEYCDVFQNENPSDALFSRGQIYSDITSQKYYQLSLLKHKPGEYYPRIYRPMLDPKGGVAIGNNNKVAELEYIVFNYPRYNPDTNLTIASSLTQISTLKGLLLDILNTVYPTKSNLKTFGHKIKNLLILSCIEVEAQLKGIYKENEIRSKQNYSTTDYIKLKDHMHLDQYSVSLLQYPNLQNFMPFKKWNLEEGATKSLKWYDDYNAVKHNSETEFHKASLESAISALCAVIILLKAQYGTDVPYWKEEIGSFFEVTDNIIWSTNDMILPPSDKSEWIPIKIGL